MARSGRGTITRSTYRPIPRAALYFELLTASLSAAGVNVKSIDTLKSGSLTPASVLLRQFTLVKSIAATIASSGGMLKSSSISVEGSVSSSAALDDIFVIALALTGAIPSVSGTLDISPSKYLTAQVDSLSGLVKSASRQLASNVSSAGAVAKLTNTVMNGYFLPESNLDTTLLAFRSLVASITPSSAVRRRSDKRLVATAGPTGALRKSLPRVLAGVISTAGAFVKQRVGEIEAISATISVETIVSITLIYEDKSVILSVDGI